MTYEQILALLDKGFSPDQVMQLRTAPDPAPTPIKEEAPAVQLDPPETPPAVIRERVVEEQPEPEWARKLNENITRMTNAIHADHIAQDLGEEKTPSAEDVMLEVLGGGQHESAAGNQSGLC